MQHQEPAGPRHCVEVGAGIKVAAVLDPFGNRFGLIENPNFVAAAVR